MWTVLRPLSADNFRSSLFWLNSNVRAHIQLIFFLFRRVADSHSYLANKFLLLACERIVWVVVCSLALNACARYDFTLMNI